MGAEGVSVKGFTPDLTSKALQDLIFKLQVTEFWGKLEISFENGKVTHCKKTETIKL